MGGGKNVKQTESAGGGVINSQGQVLVVSQRGKSWSLPKGHIDAGETPLAAARREIYEETGVSELELVKELGSYQRYKIGLDGDDKAELKTMIIFLFKTPQMDLQPIDPKHPEARWVDKEQVAELLTHPKDKDFFKQVLTDLG